MDEQRQTYEQSKADILQWKDAHREEYTCFAKTMADRNEVQYPVVCRAVFKQPPGIEKEWQISRCGNSADRFESIGPHLKENAVPEQIVELCREQGEEDVTSPPPSFWGRMRCISRQSLRKRCVILFAPLVLSWLYYGKSFETMVDMVSRQVGHLRAGNAERTGRSAVVRRVIEASIKNGFRTQEDWDRHLAMKSAIEKGGIGEWVLRLVKDKIGGSDIENNQTETTSPVTGTAPQAQWTAGKKKAQERSLVDYLKRGSKEAVIQHIRRFASINTSVAHQVFPFYVLKDLWPVAGVHAAKEYSVGMVLQFSDLPSLKSESAIRQVVGFLKAAKHVIKDGKDQMAPLIESDENRDLYRTLATETREIAADDEAETVAGQGKTSRFTRIRGLELS